MLDESGYPDRLFPGWAIVALLGPVGCAHLERAPYIGTYASEFPPGDDRDGRSRRIELLPDGKYVRSITAGPSDSSADHGKWRVTTLGVRLYRSWSWAPGEYNWLVEHDDVVYLLDIPQLIVLCNTGALPADATRRDPELPRVSAATQSQACAPPYE